jgi:hypothetical protein
MHKGVLRDEERRKQKELSSKSSDSTPFPHISSSSDDDTQESVPERVDDTGHSH